MELPVTAVRLLRLLPAASLACLTAAAPILAAEAAPAPIAETATATQAPVEPGLSLADATARALQRNMDIDVARARLGEAEATHAKTTTAFLPNIQAIGSYTHNSHEAKIDSSAQINAIKQALLPGSEPIPSSPSIIQRENTVTGALTIDETVFALAPVLQRRSAARAVDAQTASLEATRREIVYQVTQIFYNAVGVERLITTAERAIALADQRIGVAKHRYALGADGEVTMLRAETERNRAEQDLARAQLARGQLLVALGTLLGDPPPESLLPPPPLQVPAGDAAGWIESGIRDRPELRARRLALDAADISVSEAEWRWLPMVTVQGVGRYTDTPGFVGKNWLYAATANLVVPIFDRGVRYAEASERRHTRSRQRLELEKAEVDLRAGVRQAVLEIDTARRTLAVAQAQSVKARRTADIIGNAYKAGGTTSLEVSEADTNLRVSESTVERERIGLDLAILKVRHLSGAVRAP
jgi:outer membrane protein TolC